jgi:nitric oxide reductase subunit C
MTTVPWWASESAWKKIAIWVTGLSLVVLVFLTFDTMEQIAVGSPRVPAYSVINNRIEYRFDDARKYQVPVVAGEAPLFGTVLSAEAAEALVTHGKKIFQGRNCINCHTILGNGAYYAPDLTKAWLDPAWGAESARELLMIEFLKNPDKNPRTFGTGRKMPNLAISEDEAKALIAYLKWVSSIDTNGFPYNFKAIKQGG